MKKLFAALAAFALAALLVLPADAQRLRNGAELNRYGGPAVTLWLSWQVQGVATTFESSASSDASCKVDIPLDAYNVQGVILTDGHSGRAAKFQDKKPLWFKMGRPSSPGRWDILAEQSDRTQKGFSSDEKWAGFLVHNFAPQAFAVNEITILRCDHKYNNTVPTLLVKRLPYTYAQLVAQQIGAQQGVHPDAVGGPGPVVGPPQGGPAPRPYPSGVVDEPDFDPRNGGGNGPAPRRQMERPQFDDEDDDRDRPYRRGDRIASRGLSDEEDEPDFDPRGSSSSPQTPRYPRGPRGPRVPREGEVDRSMPASGMLTVQLVDRSGNPIRLRQPLAVDLYVGNRPQPITLDVTDKWTGLVPAGQVRVIMHPQDARQWLIGRFSVTKVQAGYSGILTLVEQ